ncbi:MAG: substrate-binding domain-containing protein [Candidatus Rokubacteria bacterium]|nr:substrate-binding domain-containing protein [Candidatus Rokubacteria bacterium]
MSWRPRVFRATVCAVALLAWVPVGAVSSQETIKVGGTGGAVRSIEILAEAFQKTPDHSRVEILTRLGSRGAKTALLAAVLDIAVSAQAVTPAESEQGLSGVELGRTPFVFATSSTNPVPGFTLPELVNIYAGRTLNWPDGSRLRLILRPPGDSDSDSLKRMSREMERAVTAAHGRPGLKMAATDQDSAEAIEAIPGALGTLTLALILSERRPLKALSINGVPPSQRAIADGSYPYVKTFYLVTPRTPSPRARRFLEFAGSAPGREILSRLGYWVR